MFAAVLSLAAVIAGGMPVLDAGEREPFALIVDAPSELLQQATALFRRHTDLVPIELPPEAIEGCAGSPVCMALRARAQMEKRSASFLAVISSASGRVSVLLIDLEEALRCADAGGGDEAIAQCATERALVASSLAQETFAFEVFRPALEKAGHWEPFGSIDVTIEAESIVSIDGKALGSIAGNARLEGVRPGTRKLAFERAGSLPQEVEVDVLRGAIAALSIDLVEEPSIHPARTITLWSGVGIAAVGIGICIWAAAASGPDVYCLDEECSGRDFRTFAQLTGEEGDHSGPPRAGVLALPLGYSIALTGGLFTIGSLFLGEEGDVPWIAWVAGVAAGGLAYGLSAALD